MLLSYFCHSIILIMISEIIIGNVCKKYPNGIEALKDVSLEISKGQFFTLLGPNGAGKSTLVRILTTLARKDSGHFLIAGLHPDPDYRKIQKLIGVALQDNEIDPAGTVENLLIFQARLFGISAKDATQRAGMLIELFELGNECRKKAGELSGGNKRRLHCALALVHKPQVLFLDEPTVGMDPLARANFWEIITQMNQTENVTVFLTTQYLEEADRYASNMALINEGKICYNGTIAGFKKMVNPDRALSLDDAYLKYIKTNHRQ